MSNINPNTKTYAILADSIYWNIRKGGTKIDEQIQSNWTPVPTGWELIKQESGSGKGDWNFDGFTARAYKNSTTGNIIIAYAGTEFENLAGDWFGNNLTLGGADNAEQANKAALFYHHIKHEHPNADISFTGHSLGGGLAGLMGILFDKEAVIFDHAPFKAAALADSPLVAEYSEADLKYDPSKTNLSFDEVKQKIIDLIKDKISITPDDFLYAGLGFLDGVVIDRLISGTTRDSIMKALKAQVIENQKTGTGFQEIDKAFLEYEYKDYADRAKNLYALAVKGEAMIFNHITSR